MAKSLEKQNLFKPIPLAIRNGLVMVIQILMIGSFAVLLEKINIPVYQNFIKTFAGGSISKILTFIDKSTLGMLSLYMTISVSISYIRIVRKDRKAASFACTATVLACFFIMIGFFQSGINTKSLESFSTEDNMNKVKELLFQVNRFSGRGMFSALIASIGGSVLFTFFHSCFRSKNTIYADGTDSVFHAAVATLLPSACVIVIFALFNYLIILISGCTCIQDLFVVLMDKIFVGMERSYFSGFLFIFLSQIMWCFGIHGSNVLEAVSADKFAEITASNPEIVSKSFIDNFVIMGGCGTTLALIIAILIFSRRNTTRRLARMSVVPGIFNINELITFGLPIVYNVYLLVPFVCVPLIMYTTSYLAVKSGWVAPTVNQIHWTTPVLLSGYQATGSISGSVLQAVNMGIAVLVYWPFIRWYDRKVDSEGARNLQKLVAIHKESEETLVPVVLTEMKSAAGTLAKSLVNDLRLAIEEKTVDIKYQPQYNEKGMCTGAEALLRWNHPFFGLLYPPLVVKLAREGGLLWRLEKFVLETAASNIPVLTGKFGKEFKLSVNITVATFYNPELLQHLAYLKKVYGIQDGNLCVEITEEMALGDNSETQDIFREVREMGIKLALDDFSMGHTSLQYLQNNQFDLVKIDGNLVKAMMSNTRSRDIIASIVYLSNSLNFDVVAEYVETAEEKKTLEQIGCKSYQGYLYSPAVDIEEIKKSVK